MSDLGKKGWISTSLFLTVFTALLLVATFCDLEISRIMTHFSLKEGDYYTADVFANFFEAAGMFPRYLLYAFAGISLAWFTYRAIPRKAIGVPLFLLFVGASVYYLTFGFGDLILYPMRHMIAEDAEAAVKAISAMRPTVYTLSAILSGGMVATALYATRSISVKTWERLALFACAYVLIDLLSDLSVSALKGYVDRVRYRSMNSAYGQTVGGFDLYTRWYEVTDHADLMRATPLIAYTDAFRSFPSGHTRAAGCSYALILLIDSLKIESKRIKTALWIIPCVWTGLTAMGRIVAGAHFMSDVLFGGTIPFILVIAAREIVLRRGETLRNMFLPREKRISPILEKISYEKRDDSL